jgi:hypothetical protein
MASPSVGAISKGRYGLLVQVVTGKVEVPVTTVTSGLVEVTKVTNLASGVVDVSKITNLASGVVDVSKITNLASGTVQVTNLASGTVDIGVSSTFYQYDNVSVASGAINTYGP